jgi:prevent-host-death family protein
VIIVIITATELKSNIGKYLSIVINEDIIITKNGKSVAKLVNAGNDVAPLTKSLRGVLKGVDISKESIRDERLAKHF